MVTAGSAENAEVFGVFKAKVAGNPKDLDLLTANLEELLSELSPRQGRSDLILSAFSALSAVISVFP